MIFLLSPLQTINKIIKTFRCFPDSDVFRVYTRFSGYPPVPYRVMSVQVGEGTSSFAVDPNSSSSVHDIKKTQGHRNGMFCPTQEMWNEIVRRGVAPLEMLLNEMKIVPGKKWC